MNTTDLAANVGELIGGPGNVSQVTHCATRLRFVVKDDALVHKDELSTTEGVLQVVQSGGQTQVVIGPNVGDVYRALLKQPSWTAHTGSTDGGPKKKQGPIDWLFTLLSGTFQPLLMPLLGASMLLMIYGLANQFSWFDTENPSAFWTVLFAACNAFFYFMPILIAATATRKLGGTPYLGAAIAASLLHPSFTALGETGDVVSFLGIPMVLYTYSATVFPAILIAIALSYLEAGLRRVVPANLHLVLIPTISIALLVPVAFLVIGPLGVLMGNGLVALIQAVNAFSPILMGVVFGAAFIFFVMFGLHWALVPISLLNIAAGGDPLIPITFAYNFAVWGLALGVFLKAPKGSDVRELAGAGAVSGLIAGISEPMLYGVILRYKRVIPMIIVSAAVGGGIIGAFGVIARAFGFASVFTIPLMTPTLGYVLGISVSFGLMLAAVLIFGYETKTEGAAEAAAASTTATASTTPTQVAKAPAARLTEAAVLASPLTGRVIPLEEVPDPVFAGGRVGAGVAVVPTDGRVIAPCDGTVIVAPASGHAVGIRSVDGIELLIHVGIDTVNLGGRGFNRHVEVKQQVRAGEPLVDVDLAVIAEAGYSLATPVLITNARKLGVVTPAAEGTVTAGDPLLTIAPRTADAPTA